MIKLCQKCWNHLPYSQAKNGALLCLNCTKDLAPMFFCQKSASESFGDIHVHSLFPYQDFMRELCLRIKIHSDIVAWQLLCSMSLSHPCLKDILASVDVILPVPSSLWGRLRGRLDIAGLWSRELSQYGHKKEVYLPRQAYFWRLRKRALSKGKRAFSPRIASRAADIAHFWHKITKQPLASPIDLGNLRVLVVDDIVTTGFSMEEIGKKIGTAETIYLSLFRSKF